MIRCRMTSERPSTLGQLRSAVAAGRVSRRSVRDELRANLITRLTSREPIFPGIIGYDDTVVPQIVNAILSRHNFILLGLRGQAKSRILRALAELLDDAIPVVPGLRDPRRSAGADLCRRAGRGSRPRATPCRSAGCRARRATSRSWRRRT